MTPQPATDVLAELLDQLPEGHHDRPGVTRALEVLRGEEDDFPCCAPTPRAVGRAAAFIVVLDQDYKDEDADRIQDTLGMVRGVASVEPYERDAGDHIAEARARTGLGVRVLDAVRGAIYPDLT